MVGMKKINSINWEELKRLNSKYFKNLKRELINLEDTAQYTLGPNVQKLEKEIAKYIGVKYCVAVGNGIVRGRKGRDDHVPYFCGGG